MNRFTVTSLVALAALGACGTSASPPPPAAAPPEGPAVVNVVGDAATVVVGDAAGPHAPGTQSFTATFTRAPLLVELRTLGELLFRERTLSRAGSCASCHDPAHAFGEAKPHPGRRVAPSLRYLQGAPPFMLGKAGPSGGLMWDGRATMHEQLRAAWFSADEMAIASPHELATKLASSRIARQFRDTYGQDIFDSNDQAMEAIVLALDVYTEDRARFFPYASDFDDVGRGKAVLTAPQTRGRARFEASCAACHPDSGRTPIFTTFGYGTVKLPAARVVDRGLCARTDLAAHPELCGMFRIPSLRNVAVRPRFFHDGSIKTLSEAVKLSGVPDAADVADIVAFLKTLTDH